ncbi:prepilin-type N-terminal cleavage/methylation domain-containing protein [Candidatus Sumerlaeota bacterium]|nr:prepilin-type N-terminal cleavage/methylation domain-containing protein [Candidatus Sumerlaeota bacterium]
MGGAAPECQRHGPLERLNTRRNRLAVTHPRAFTLIELLVVVAIISILAAIALPNFIEASTRARVTRAKADMRTIAMGIEMYRVDHNRYPPAQGVGVHLAPIFANPVAKRLVPLTTPVAFLTSIPLDPFPPRDVAFGDPAELPLYNAYDYVDADHEFHTGSALTSGAQWRLCSAGPDLVMAFGGYLAGSNPANPLGVDYDPTNGVLSAGDICHVGGGVAPTPGGSPSDPANPYRPGILRVPTYREQYQ